MSLTSFLNYSDVKTKFRTTIPKPKMMAKHPLLAEPQTEHYSLVGTAFDYLLRFYVEYLNPTCIKKDIPWVAISACLMLRDQFPALAKQAATQILEAKDRLDEFIETGQLTDELLESALLLARIDPIYRANRGHSLIGNIDPADITDLRHLINLVDLDMFRAKQRCLLNPTFGSGSILVGGADADIVLDDMLIDIKTTKNFEFKREYFNQLVGYYILHQLGGIEGVTPKITINKLAIYYARQGYLHTLAIEDIIEESTFPQFIAWFEQRAKEIFGENPPLKAMIILAKKQLD